jgi:chromatin assembly factor 1 subunit B
MILTFQVFDPAELGTLHPTQQHHRQLQNIAEAHSHSHTSHSLPPLFPSSSSNLSQSPALARASPAPPQSERESSTSSSIATPVRPPAGSVRPPLSGTTSVKAPSSVSGATDPAMPTPSDEHDDFALRAPSSSAEPSVKRSTEESDGSDAAPKKKRRVNLTHLGGLDQ